MATLSRFDRRTLLMTGLAAIAAPACASIMPGKIGLVSYAPKLTTFLPGEFAPGDGERVLARAREVGGAAELVFNVVQAARTPNAPYGAVLEAQFADRAALDRHAAQEPVAPGGLRLVTHGVTIRPPGDRGAKRIGLVGRADGVKRDAFVRDWRDLHALDVDRQPGLSGYQLNVADPRQPQPQPWDGYAELWWPDWETWRTATAARLQEPSSKSFFARRLLLLVEEHGRMA